MPIACDTQAAAASTDGKKKQCSKIVDGPGGVKWEIFEDCPEEETVEKACPPSPVPACRTSHSLPGVTALSHWDSRDLVLVLRGCTGELVPTILKS